MEFDDSWTVEDLATRVTSSAAAFNAERVVVEVVHGKVHKDRNNVYEHGKVY
jgi:hypothetical protein